MAQLGLTRRGFMGAYIIRWWHDDGTLVNVRMALIEEAMHMLATMPIPGIGGPEA